MNVKLSVLCTVYNHEKYLRQALDSILMQKTDFDYEVLISDDASTDSSQEIIKEYQARFPDIVKPVLLQENEFGRGVNVDKKYNWTRISGQYVAICEGDDYWTDEFKLQKQVDYLDAHNDCYLCFHPVRVKWEDGSGKEDVIFPNEKERFYKNVFKFDDIKKGNFIQTNSVVYRWILKENEDKFPEKISPADFFLHLLHIRCGYGFMLNDVMAVYRRHSDSLWYGAGKSNNFYLKNGLSVLAFYKAIDAEFGINAENEAALTMSRILKACLEECDFEKMALLSHDFPKLYNDLIAQIDFPDKKMSKKRKKRRKIKRIFIAALLLIMFVLIAFFLFG